MQNDTLLPLLSLPLALNTALSTSRQASTSGLPSENETDHHACLKGHRKPSISKVILGVVANKGAHTHVSLATLKKAVTTTGYNMTRNAWCFKRALKGLVDKGILKQMTGKGASSSFCMGKKNASKFKLKAKSRQQQQRGWPGQRRLMLGSKHGRKQQGKGVRRVAKCSHN
ncbi:histone H1.9-like [Manis javanica]|uniref:histone H1.9-like n=1 Tax=Manis javanica TaxID=9974 RepID=UPI000813360A